ncbi:MAG: hypothetical protein OEO23_12665 [Gemmatimonadota bacterium]|nr:hypothetical protein [Gemmatimonadota bacterium]
MRSPVLFIPVVTTLLAFPFAWTLLRHYRDRRSSTYMAWWAAGVFLYGVGTLTESLVSVLGWHPIVFKSWYISGALLGGAPLAQGTVYLLLPRRVAHRLSVALITVVAVAAACVVLSPIDMSLVESHRLTGRVLEWQWVRRFSPFINLYAVIFLVGGAIWSAFKYRAQPDQSHRFKGNVLIAIGAILPGIGGSFTRFGHTEVLYVTELLGLILIWAGYRYVRDGGLRGTMGESVATAAA